MKSSHNYENVSDAPTVTLSPSTLFIEDGETAAFTCVVGGHPITSVMITFGAVSIDCMTSCSGSDGSCSSTADSADYVVEIPSFSPSKNGTYNCKASSVWYKGKATSNKVDRSDDGDIILKYGKIESSLHLSSCF